MSVSLSLNMNLPVPDVGVEPGPDWALDLNNCLTVIDAHTHSPGSGVQITPTGLNINADLPFNNNDLTTARSIRFQPQSTNISDPTDIGCLYEVLDDLYYNDGSGNQIRITQSGGVVGTPGSISGLVSPASATYIPFSETFVWQSAANTAANMDFRSAIFRNNTMSSFGITVSAPNSLAADYAIVWPTLPASIKFLTIDSSGNMSALYYVDNSTIEIVTNNLQVKDLGITTAKIDNLAVTTAKIDNLAVTDAKIANATITAAKLAFSVLSDLNITTFSASGTWTKPAGLSQALVVSIGGGGGGGGASNTATNNGGTAGGGGGAGGCCIHLIDEGSLGATETVTIGSGGAGGGNTGGNAGSGTSTTFGSFHTAGGGGGGNGATTSAAQDDIAASAGAGGTASGATINTKGNAGATGAAHHGTNMLATGGSGAGSYLGGGARGGTASSPGSAAGSAAGANSGAGGGGAADNNLPLGGAAGGNGGSGFCFVIEILGA